MSTFEQDQFRDNVKARVNLSDWITRDGVPLKGGGNEFKACCPFHVEQTPSFSVFCKDGVWGYHCFGACNAGGDIFTWVMQRKGLGFVEALKLVASEVGMGGQEARARGPETRLYQPPEARSTGFAPRAAPFDPSKYIALDPNGGVARYLCGERGLPLELLTRYSVGQTADGEAYALAYKWQPPGAKNPRFEFCKIVNVARVNGKKSEWRDPKGGKNILFGMMAIPPEATCLVIAEGEIDAMTWAHYGQPAVSVPGGAGYLGWIEHCYDWLARFKRIHISFDEDRAGRAKLVEVVQRLDMARTDIVRLPEREAEVAIPQNERGEREAPPENGAEISDVPL